MISKRPLYYKRQNWQLMDKTYIFFSLTEWANKSKNLSRTLFIRGHEHETWNKCFFEFKVLENFLTLCFFQLVFQIKYQKRFDKNETQEF